jgi:Spy/CpxP family protein refolding chaperone
MSSKTLLTVLLVASLAGNASFLITKFSKRPSPHAGLVSQLVLTPDQTAKFAASKSTFQDQRAQTLQKMAALRSALADEFAKEAPDRQKLLATAAGMVEIQTAMRPKLIEHLLSLHPLLTLKQRATLANLMRTGGGSEAVCPGAMLYPTRDEERQ